MENKIGILFQSQVFMCCLFQPLVVLNNNTENDMSLFV